MHVQREDIFPPPQPKKGPIDWSKRKLWAVISCLKGADDYVSIVKFVPKIVMSVISDVFE